MFADLNPQGERICACGTARWAGLIGFQLLRPLLGLLSAAAGGRATGLVGGRPPWSWRCGSGAPRSANEPPAQLPAVPQPARPGRPRPPGQGPHARHRTTRRGRPPEPSARPAESLSRPWTSDVAQAIRSGESRRRPPDTKRCPSIRLPRRSWVRRLPPELRPHRHPLPAPRQPR